MAKAKKPPTIHERVSENGYVRAYDVNGRPCWDRINRERVIALTDLRKYGVGLHIGQLGWTLPETTDGYKSIDVVFDCGPRLSLNVRAICRVEEATANTTSLALIERYRNTRFDIDPSVALIQREAWIASRYAKYLSLKETTHFGEGDQELYAFTFPTLRELAALKGQESYPVKVGCSMNCSDGSLGRIRGLILEAAAYPERPEILCIWRTWDSHDLEKQVHSVLRKQKRKHADSLGREWYLTSKAELIEIVGQCTIAPFTMRPFFGASETLEEDFEEMLKEGTTIEMSTVPDSAGVRLGIKYSDDRT